jgi:hypothetical protein
MSYVRPYCMSASWCLEAQIIQMRYGRADFIGSDRGTAVLVSIIGGSMCGLSLVFGYI